MSFPSSFVRTVWERASPHVLFCGAAVIYPVLFRNIIVFDRLQLWSDAFRQLQGAEQFVAAKTFRLVGKRRIFPDSLRAAGPATRRRRPRA